jgi:L-threonylcarbamoyladenylate synthase
VDIAQIIDHLKNGEIGGMPTDTIFGIVADANNRSAVERIYSLKGRESSKPFIVLISDATQLKTKLGIELDPIQVGNLMDIWQEPVSVILPFDNPEYEYLHRGTRSLAVRLPQLAWLREVIDNTGPVVATSANKSGMPVSSSIEEIKLYIPEIDFYIDGTAGVVASRLAKMQTDGSIEWLNRV